MDHHADLEFIALLESCKERKRPAQKLLYQKYYRYGMGICMRYLDSEDEAILCFNDAFLKVFNNLDKFDTNKDFKPWFKTILINTILNYFKRNKKKAYFEQLKCNLYGDQTPLINSLLNYKDILKSIQSLSLAYRTVFNLYVMDGFNHQEISSMLNISESTSRSNLTRAKIKLREILTSDTYSYHE